METYYSIQVFSIDEILMALLTQFDIESIEEHDNYFFVYVKASTFTDTVRTSIEHLLQTHKTEYKIEEIQHQNWNEIWESSFQPVIVHDYCQVRADFHPPQPNIKYDLIINPKMAFGTGHHATTWMMIDHMSLIDFGGKQVLDFGCGTGILAILAAKSGAKSIHAIDIEYESYINTIENAAINSVNIICVHGELRAAPSEKYDVILANINRNILQKYANDLFNMLYPTGHLLISGVLVEDCNMIISTFTNEGIQPYHLSDKEGWVCISFEQNQVSTPC